jgi:nucleoid DNA-binding protein
MNHAELVEKVAEVAQTTKADAARAVWDCPAFVDG